MERAMNFSSSGGIRASDSGFSSCGIRASALGFSSYGIRANDFITGFGFSSGGTTREALHLRKLLETALKSSTQQSGSTQAAVLTSSAKLPDQIPKEIGIKFFGQSWPMLFIEEMRKCLKMFSINLDRYYVMGTSFLNYLRVGAIFVVAVGGCFVGYYALKRIGNWFSQEWWTPTSPQSFKNRIKSFVKKGELTKAKETLDRMINRGYIPERDLFEALLGKLLEDFNISLASKVLKCMSELRVVGDTDVVANVLKSLLLIGRVVEAIQQLELLLEIGVIPNFPGLIDYLCGEHKSIAAWKILEFGFVRNCAIDERISFKVFDSLISTNDALAGYSLLVKCYICNCDRTRLDCLIEMLNLQGYRLQADIVSTMWGHIVVDAEHIVADAER